MGKRSAIVLGLGIGGGLWALSKLLASSAGGVIADDAGAAIDAADGALTAVEGVIVGTGGRFATLLPIYTAAAAKYGVPLSYVLGISGWETRGSYDPSLVAGYGTADARRGGSFGVMQMSMTTARGLGYSGPDLDLNNVVGTHWQGAIPPGSLLDPAVNIDLGARLIAQLNAKYGNFADVAAAYNSGHPVASAPAITLSDYVPGAEGYQATYASYDDAASDDTADEAAS